MKKGIILIISFIVSCSFFSKKEIDINSSRLDKPLKIIYKEKGNDSTYLYLCFPKRITMNNVLKTTKVLDFHLGHYQNTKDQRHYRTYKYNKKLLLDINLDSGKKKSFSFDIYYGYLMKLKNSKLLELLINTEKTQQLGNLEVYNIKTTKDIKNWALSKINDSIKGQLHFKLYNKEKGFFYKSLDIELFED
jgi:hypothetical protein